MIKLAVISDLHLGYSYGTERGEDAFENARRAFEIIIRQEPNMIVLLGDIFDSKIPKQEVLGRTIELFKWTKNMLKSEVKMVKRVKENKEEDLNRVIPPIVGIYGTHERRHFGSTNPVQILEKAELLQCLHAESVLLEVGTDKLGIHGLSGVPDNYAKEVMKTWDPQPFPVATNILLAHQSLGNYIPVNGLLELSDLPMGFDLFLLGHHHQNIETKHPRYGTPVLIPGSTVLTQLTKTESVVKKGFYMIELGREKGNVRFMPIETRPYFYEKIDVTDRAPIELLPNIVEKIRQHLMGGQKPLIKVKLEGTLAKGASPSDLNFSEIFRQFANKAILNIDKSKVISKELAEHSNFLADLKEKKISIDAIGINLLSKTLKEEPEKVEYLFNLLAEGNLEKAEEVSYASENKIE